MLFQRVGKLGCRIPEARPPGRLAKEPISGCSLGGPVSAFVAHIPWGAIVSNAREPSLSYPDYYNLPLYVTVCVGDHKAINAITPGIVHTAPRILYASLCLVSAIHSMAITMSARQR